MFLSITYLYSLCFWAFSIYFSSEILQVVHGHFIDELILLYSLNHCRSTASELIHFSRVFVSLVINRAWTGQNKKEPSIFLKI